MPGILCYALFLITWVHYVHSATWYVNLNGVYNIMCTWSLPCQMDALRTNLDAITDKSEPQIIHFVGGTQTITDSDYLYVKHSSVTFKAESNVKLTDGGSASTMSFIYSDYKSGEIIFENIKISNMHRTIIKDAKKLSLSIKNSYFQDVKYIIDGTISSFSSVDSTYLDLGETLVLRSPDDGTEVNITGSTFHLPNFPANPTETYLHTRHVRMKVSNSRIFIFNSTFSRRGIFMDLTRMFKDNSSVILDNVTFSRCENEIGGALRINNENGDYTTKTHFTGHIAIRNSRFFSNCASVGPSIYLKSSLVGWDIDIDNTAFECNGRTIYNTYSKTAGFTCPNPCRVYNLTTYYKPYEFGGAFYGSDQGGGIQLSFKNSKISKSMCYRVQPGSTREHAERCNGTVVYTHSSGSYPTSIIFENTVVSDHFTGHPIFSRAGNAENVFTCTNSNFTRMYGTIADVNNPTAYDQATYPYYFTSQNAAIRITLRQSFFSGAHVTPTTRFTRSATYVGGKDIYETDGGLFNLRTAGYTGTIHFEMYNSGFLGPHFNSDTAGGCITTPNHWSYYGETYITIENSQVLGCSSKTSGGFMWVKPMYTGYTKSITLRHSRFQNCFSGSDGGVFFVDDGTAEIRMFSSQFISNSALGSGGVMYSRMNVINSSLCWYSQNSAVKNGGALYLVTDYFQPSTHEFRNCTFSGNSQTGRSSLAVSGGGSIYYFTDSKEPSKNIRFESCIFESSKSQYLDGGVMVIVKATLYFSRCVFRLGSAGRMGGTFFVKDAMISISDSEVTNSEAVGNGGFMYVVTGSNVQSNVRPGIRTKNLAVTNATSTGGDGGCISSAQSKLYFQNTSFSYCTSTKDGGAIHLADSDLYVFNPDDIPDGKDPPPQVCISHENGESAIVKNNGTHNVTTIVWYRQDGTTSISHSSALRGGGVFADKDSSVATYQNFVVSHCSAQLGGGLYLLSGALYPGHDFKIENNSATYGAAATLSTAIPPNEFSANTYEITKQHEWFECVYLNNNNGTFLKSTFFMLSSKSDFGTNTAFLKYSRCKHSDEEYCTGDSNWVTLPSKLARSSATNEDLTTVASWTATNDGNSTSPVLEVFPRQVFYLYYSARTAPINGNGSRASYPMFFDFSATMESSVDLITSTKFTQQLQNYLFRFEDLAISAETNSLHTIKLRGSLMGQQYEDTLTVRIGECPEGYEISHDRKSCTACPRGFYKYWKGNTLCDRCVEGMDCEANIVSVKNAYWASVDSQNKVAVYSCVNSHCAGGTMQFTQQRVNVSMKCEEFRDPTAPLCNSCGQDYVMFGEECRPCKNKFNILPFLSIFLLQVVLFSWIHIATGVSTSKKSLKSGEEDDEIQNNSASILVNFLQSAFVVVKLSTLVLSNQLVEKLRETALSNLQVIKNFFMFSPSVGSNTALSDCPFAVSGHGVLLWRLIQQLIIITLCLLPLLFMCYHECIFKTCLRCLRCCCCGINTCLKCCEFFVCLKFIRGKKMKPVDFSTFVMKKYKLKSCENENENDTIVGSKKREEEEENNEMVEKLMESKSLSNEVIMISPSKIEDELDELDEREDEFDIQEKQEDDEKGTLPPDSCEGGGNVVEDGSPSTLSIVSADLSDEEMMLGEEEEMQEFFPSSVGEQLKKSEDVVSSSSSSSSSSPRSSGEEEEEEDGESEFDEEDDIFSTEFANLLMTDFLEMSTKRRKIHIVRCCCFIPRFLCHLISFRAFRATLIKLAFMMHTPMSMIVLDFFFCANFSTGYGWRNMKYSFMTCYDTSYTVWMLLLYFPLLLYVVFFPILVSLFLCCNYRRLKKKSFKASYGVCYDSYRLPNCFYYESVNIYFRLALVVSGLIVKVVLLTFPNYRGSNHVLNVLIVAVALVLHHVIKPFASRVENHLQTVALFSLLLIAGVQSEGYIRTYNIGMYSSFFIFVFVVSILVFFCIFRIPAFKNCALAFCCCCCCCLVPCFTNRKGRKMKNRQTSWHEEDFNEFGEREKKKTRDQHVGEESEKKEGIDHTRIEEVEEEVLEDFRGDEFRKEVEEKMVETIKEQESGKICGSVIIHGTPVSDVEAIDVGHDGEGVVEENNLIDGYKM